MPRQWGSARRLFDSTRLRRAVDGRTNRRAATPAIFIHIPKSAGKSVHLGLGLDKLKNLRDAVNFYHPDFATSFGHMSLRDLVATDVITTAQVERSFVFTVVRNPYTRAVSLYRYLRQIRRWEPVSDVHARRGEASGSAVLDLEAIQADFIDFLEAVRCGVPPVGLYNARGLSQGNPQHHWLTDVKVDLIGRYETIGASFAEISARVLGRRTELPRVNVSKVASDVRMVDFLTDTAVDLIRDIYDEDFRMFGYSTDISAISDIGTLE